MTKQYMFLGIMLTTIGVALVLVSYLVIDSVLLTSSGISIIILGATGIGVSYAEPLISPRVSEILLKTGVDNISAILEFLDINNKAVYLPRSMRDGNRALIPFPSAEGDDKNKVIEELAGNLIVKWEFGSGNMALAVSTVGNVCLEYLNKRLRSTKDSIESALKQILVQKLDLASSVKVKMGESQVTVDVGRATLMDDDTLFYRCLGSPVASVAAAICSEALDRIVSIQEEIVSPAGNKKNVKIMLEVLL